MHKLVGHLPQNELVL